MSVNAGPNTHTHTLFFFVPLTSRGSCHERPCTNYPLRRPHQRKGGGISPTDGTYARSNAKNEWPFSRPTRQKLLQGIPGHQGPRTPKTQNYQTNKHTHTHTNKYLVPTAAARVTRGSIPIQCYCFVFPVRFGRGVASAKYPCFWASSPAQGRPQALPGTTRKTEYQH